MVRTGPLVALFGQCVLLTVLSDTAGLSWVGWLVGVTVSLFTIALLRHGLARCGAIELGPANRVTLGRATLVGGVAALVADASVRPLPAQSIVVLSTAALLLDTVDGRVARRTGTVSRLGARFDMEVDAFLILVLSAYVAASVGGWVLAIGLARYAFVGCGRLWPWLREPSPPRYWCKIVAAGQGIVLTIAVADVLPGVIAAIALAVSLALLAESFGREAWWLRQSHRSATVVEVGRPELAGVR